MLRPCHATPNSIRDSKGEPGGAIEAPIHPGSSPDSLIVAHQSRPFRVPGQSSFSVVRCGLTRATATVVTAVPAGRQVRRQSAYSPRPQARWPSKERRTAPASFGSWEALVGNDPYAIEYQGDEVAILMAMTETHFPLLRSRSAIAEASIDNLYYGLVGVDPLSATVDDFIFFELGIDFDLKLDESEPGRAWQLRVNPVGDLAMERQDIWVRCRAKF